MAMNQSFGADLRSNFLGVSLSSVVSYGEEFNEDDIWGEIDEPDVEERETAADSRSAQVEAPYATSAHVINRAGWHATASHLSLLSRSRGLSALAAEATLGSGQGPGGGAGDILRSSVNITPSLFIPKGLSSKADALRPMRRASAPVNVPDWSKVTGSSLRQSMEALDTDEEEDGNMVPPHELMARECAKSVSFSVREGVGRTLKGRDLDHVRAAVLRKTGFLDS